MTSTALLRQCLPSGEALKKGQEQAWKEEPLSSWRLGTMQDALVELVKQQSGLQRSVQEMAEMQRELRLFLQESQSCLEQRLADIVPSNANKGVTEGRLENILTGERTGEQPLQAAPETIVVEDQIRQVSSQPQDTEPMKPAPVEAQPPQEEAVEPLLYRILCSAYFDMAMAVLILMNFVTIYLEAELKAWDIREKLGLVPVNTKDWPLAKTTLNGFEGFFNVIFSMELVLRLAVLGPRKACRSALDVLDAFVSVLCTVSFFLDMITEGFRYSDLVAVLRVTRLLRALRLLRFVRVLRLMTWLSPLRVLVHTIAMSVDSLMWALLVMGGIIVSSGLLVSNLVTDFLYDETKDLSDREWVFSYFGSATRASYTMFEATFSGIWASRLSRRMIEEISPWFMLFWCAYTCAVNFAVIRVVSALFLKRTLDVAQNDAEAIALAKLEEKEKVMTSIRDIFRVADQTGDGVLTRWEFDAMMENRQVLSLFLEVCDLEVPELQLLFNLLCQDDGVVDQGEFLAGAMKLKSDQVKLIDIIQVHHEQTILRRRLEDLKDGMERVDEALHPETPWRAGWNGMPGSPQAAKGGKAKKKGFFR